MNKNPKVHVRWMIRRDMPEVLRIENQSFDFPWSDDDFIRCLRQRNCIGMVAEVDDRVVGYMIYELHKIRLHVINFAVDPTYRNKDVGTKMIQKLIDKLSYGRRTRIMLEIQDSNLGGQMFFATNGFKAVSVIKGFYEQGDSDAYLMQYVLPPADIDSSKSQPKTAVTK